MNFKQTWAMHVQTNVSIVIPDTLRWPSWAPDLLVHAPSMIGDQYVAAVGSHVTDSPVIDWPRRMQITQHLVWLTAMNEECREELIVYWRQLWSTNVGEWITMFQVTPHAKCMRGDLKHCEIFMSGNSCLDWSRMKGGCRLPAALCGEQPWMRNWEERWLEILLNTSQQSKGCYHIRIMASHTDSLFSSFSG